MDKLLLLFNFWILSGLNVNISTHGYVYMNQKFPFYLKTFEFLSLATVNYTIRCLKKKTTTLFGTKAYPI